MKTVIILRGLPGSGKSTIATMFQDAVIVSMDNFWLDKEGNYNFVKKMIPQAVNWVHTQYIKALEESKLVVVDNTHSRIWEMEYYMDQAQMRGFKCHILNVECTVDESKKRNTHDVPEYAIDNMAKRWEPLFSLP